VQLHPEWRESQKFPSGDFVRAIGRAGDIIAETAAILATNGIDWDVPFTEDVVADLPEIPGMDVDDDENDVGDDGDGGGGGGKKAEPWQIPAEEYANPLREDLRHLRVISVDPETARDLDDALSISKTAEGNFEVGIHIADVTYFVSPGTALDAEAASRTTSTYLVQRVIPMLPGLLSQDLCSLNPGVDRLAFSALVTLNPRGEVIAERFTRSVIRSDCRLAYAQAQKMIDDEYTPAEIADENSDIGWRVEAPHTSGGGGGGGGGGNTARAFTRADVVADIKQLDRLARTMRRKRFANGAVRINKSKLHFKIDPETGDPLEVSGYPIKDANRMIEEFMLLANIRVAYKISNVFPERALLRNHPAPLERGWAKFTTSLKAAGYPIDTSSTLAFMRSIESDAFPEAVRDVLHIMASRPMRPAAYFCTGDPEIEVYKEWKHWALSIDRYTHFTSPIRRYPDVVVHRLLYAALVDEFAQRVEAGDPDVAACPESAAEIRERAPTLAEMTELVTVAERCNEHKLAAKRSGEMSGVLYLCLMLKDRGPMKLRASVFDLWSGGLAVVVREYTLEYRLKHEALHADTFEYREDTHSARVVNAKALIPAPEGSLSAQPSFNVFAGERIVKLFDEVEIELVVRTDRTPMDFGVRFLGFVDAAPEA
jgi:DIS3-like exonuclease 2